MLSEVGGREAYAGAAAEYYERNGADASLDINQFSGGEPRTLVPHVAHGAVSLRLAPGQRAADIGPELERLLREGAHPDADVSFKWHLADPSLFEPDLPALVLAAQAIERATGTAPALVRSGGSIPVVAEFAARAHPDHRERLRAARRRHPRAQRVVPAGEPRARLAHRARAADLAGRAVSAICAAPRAQ